MAGVRHGHCVQALLLQMCSGAHAGRHCNARRRRSPRGLAGVDASSSLALSDEVSGALVGNDLKVVGPTGV